MKVSLRLLWFVEKKKFLGFNYQSPVDCLGNIKSSTPRIVSSDVRITSRGLEGKLNGLLLSETFDMRLVSASLPAIYSSLPLPASLLPPN